MNMMLEVGRTAPHVTFISEQTLESGVMPWQKACLLANDANKATSSVSLQLSRCCSTVTNLGMRQSWVMKEAFLVCPSSHYS